MAKAHQRDVRDDQDRQQGQQACMVLLNVTVLISWTKGHGSNLHLVSVLLSGSIFLRWGSSQRLFQGSC